MVNPAPLEPFKPSVYADLLTALQGVAATCDTALDAILPLPQNTSEQPLWQAMRHSVLGGGKRIRPFLVMEITKLLGGNIDSALRAGLAVELLHTYALVHDDLPAMDNADTRRGKPSCHVAFDEATAILVGDGLQALAFEVLANPITHPDPLVRAELVLHLAKAAGVNGMVMGQMLDLQGEKQAHSLQTITRCYDGKTGAILGFCCMAAGIISGVDSVKLEKLQQFGLALGRLFQIVDDILDFEGNTLEVGKPTGLDQTAGKSTYVSLLGLEAARTAAGSEANTAMDLLNEIFGSPVQDTAGHLPAMVAWLQTRKM